MLATSPITSNACRQVKNEAGGCLVVLMPSSIPTYCVVVSFSNGRKYRDAAQFPGGCGERSFTSSRLFEAGGPRGGGGSGALAWGDISRRCDLAVTTS